LCFAAVRDTNVSSLPPSPLGVVDSEKLGLCALSSGTFQIGRLLTGGGFLIAGVGGSGELEFKISGFEGGFGKGLSIGLNFLVGFCGAIAGADFDVDNLFDWLDCERVSKALSARTFVAVVFDRVGVLSSSTAGNLEANLSTAAARTLISAASNAANGSCFTAGVVAVAGAAAGVR